MMMRRSYDDSGTSGDDDARDDSRLAHPPSPASQEPEADAAWLSDAADEVESALSTGDEHAAAGEFEEGASPDLDAADDDEAWTYKDGSRLLPLPTDQDHVEVVVYDSTFQPMKKHSFRLGVEGERPEELSASDCAKIKLLSVGSIRAFKRTQDGPWALRLGLDRLIPRVRLSDGATLDVVELTENLEGVGAKDEHVIYFAQVQGQPTRISHGHPLWEAAAQLRLGGAGRLTPADDGQPVVEIRLAHMARPRDVSPFGDGSLCSLVVARSASAGSRVKPAPGDLLEARVTWPGEPEAVPLKWESGSGAVCDALELGALHAGAGESLEMRDGSGELLVSFAMPASAAFSSDAWGALRDRKNAVESWCAQAKLLYYDDRVALAYFLWSLSADLLKEDTEEDLCARALRTRCLGNLAACRLSRCEPAKALPFAEEACALSPAEASPAMWMRVARAAEGAGDHERALDAATKAEAAPGPRADADVRALRARARARAAARLTSERAFCARALGGVL